jgi:hypothetical protein
MAPQEDCSALVLVAGADDKVPDRTGLKGRRGLAVQRLQWHHISTVAAAGARNSEAQEQCDALVVAG